MITFDPKPLVDAIDRRGGLSVLMGIGDAYVDVDGVVHRTYVTRAEWSEYRTLARQLQRMRKGFPITVGSADKWCIKVLGLNPCFVFGQVWWDSVAEPDAETLAWLEGAA